MFCKNLIVYNVSNLDVLNKINNKLLQEMAFTPCSALDSSKGGFISPINDQHVMIIEVGDHALLQYQTEQKTIPSDVIKRAVNEKTIKQEQVLNRKLTKGEKATLKDEVMVDLMPRAFSRFNQYNVWINKCDKQIAISASSFKQAENILAHIRKELGLLALTPLSIDKPLEQIMTNWVKEKLSFPPFTLGDQAELKDPLEGNGIISCKNQEITSSEMQSHFDSGKWVTKLRIYDERGVNFIVNNDFTFKQIKFNSVVLDENEDVPLDDKEARIKADFFLATNILSKSITELRNALNKIM